MVKIITIILIHLIGDFFLQGSKLSTNKSSKMLSLLQHVGIYTLTLIILSPLWLGLTIYQGLEFSLINGVLHLIVDYITSKKKLRFWSQNENRYITVVGLDQVVHILILIVTYLALYPNILSAPTIFD